jgi:hypothetical protein
MKIFFYRYIVNIFFLVRQYNLYDLSHRTAIKIKIYPQLEDFLVTYDMKLRL